MIFALSPKKKNLLRKLAYTFEQNKLVDKKQY